MNRRDFLRGSVRRLWRAPGVTRRRRRPVASGRAGRSSARLPPRRRHGRGRHAVPPQQRRVRRQAAARNAGRRLRVPRLRRRRLAGHPARQRHGLARPQAASGRRCASIATTATARSPTSRAPPAWTSRCTAWAWPSATTTTTAFPTSLVTCVGQNRLFRNTGKGTFVDVTRASGLGGRTAFSTSALWFDFDRDGLLDLFVCNYVKWSPEHDVFCSLDGKQKSYCTPEAYRGDTCWLFRNRGNGTFEDVTATSGIFDTSSKSLGVAMLDYDQDGWPDLFVANDTQPNKLYRNMRNGTFKDVAVEAGLAFSADGKARAGMGVDAGDFDNSGRPGLADHELRQRDDRPVPSADRPASTKTWRCARASARPSRNTLGFGCVFADLDLDGALDLVVANGHIDETVRNIRGNVGYAQPPHLFLNQGNGTFRDVAAERGREFAQPRVGRGLAYGDFDRDGDLDSSGHHQQRSGVALSQRSTRRQPQPALASGRHQIESRRDRRLGANLPRRHVSVADGEKRFELSVSVGAAGDLRCRQTRPRRTCRGHLAERPDRRDKNVATGRAYECVEGRDIALA